MIEAGRNLTLQPSCVLPVPFPLCLATKVPSRLLVSYHPFILLTVSCPEVALQSLGFFSIPLSASLLGFLGGGGGGGGSFVVVVFLKFKFFIV